MYFDLNRYSPNIKEIKVVSHRKVRRARLYYLRDKLPRLSTFKWAPPVLCCLQPPKVAKLSHSCFHPLLCKNCLFVWLSFGFCFSSCNNITVTYEKSKSKCLVRLPVEVLILSGFVLFKETRRPNSGPVNPAPEEPSFPLISFYFALYTFVMSVCRDARVFWV